MIPRHIRPKRAAPLAARPNGGNLFFDSLNDSVNLSDSTFYQFGGSNFTIYIRGLFLKLGDGASGSRLAQMFQKGLTNAPSFYWVGTVGGGNPILGFRFGHGTPSAVNRIFGTSYNLESHLGEWLDIFFVRKNQDGTLAAANNVANYSVVVNGFEYPCSIVSNTGTLTSDPFTNNNIARFRATATTDFTGLYSRAVVFNRVLNTDEQMAARSGFPPSAGMRGYYIFDSLSGTILYDRSSVANNGTLINYGNADIGIPDPATNFNWVGDSIGFTSNTTKVFTAPRDINITRAVKFNAPGVSATFVHKRAGVTLNTYPLAFTAVTENVSISMMEDDTLEITIAGFSMGSVLQACAISLIF